MSSRPPAGPDGAPPDDVPKAASARSRKLVDQLIRENLGSGRTHPPLRAITAVVNAKLTAAGLAPVSPRTVDLRMKALHGRRWARRVLSSAGHRRDPMEKTPDQRSGA